MPRGGELAAYVLYNTRHKNRIPKARLRGLFGRNIYKKDGMPVLDVIAFHCIGGLFYLGEIITRGKKFGRDGKKKETRLIHVSTVFSYDKRIIYYTKIK